MRNCACLDEQEPTKTFNTPDRKTYRTRATRKIKKVRRSYKFTEFISFASVNHAIEENQHNVTKKQLTF